MYFHEAIKEIYEGRAKKAILNGEYLEIVIRRGCLYRYYPAMNEICYQENLLIAAENVISSNWEISKKLKE